MNWRFRVFKLVAVGGKLRGKEFVLNEGENIVGRGMDCDCSIQVDGVSKKHMSITVNGDDCFVQDLNSSNGTFVNGKLVKKKTIQGKDKITLPNVIFQLVFVKEKKKIIKKQVAKASGEEVSLDYKEAVPKDFLGKMKYQFKHKLMSVIYNFNEQYEWNVLLGILLFIFVCASISLTVGPVLLTSKKLIVQEVKARGTQYVNEVSRVNAIHLSRGDLERIDTNFLEDREKNEGVESYELFDMEGRIIRPASKIDTYINDTFSIRAKNYFASEKNYQKVNMKGLGGGEVGIAKALLVHNIQTGSIEPVGVVAIRFKPNSLQTIAASNSSAYLEALIYTSLIAVIFFGFVYYMTLKPLEELRYQIEEVLRGKRKDLESAALFSEINPIRNTVNSLLQRLRELQSEDTAEFAEIEDDSEYIASLKEFMEGAQGPVLILNSEKNIEHLNPECEDLIGIRESSGAGTSLLDSARDQGFAATVIDLCDQSANNNGTNQNDVYELTGKNFIINITGLVGKDNFAKAFYITFVLDE